MMWRTEGACECGHKVSSMVISDAHDPKTYIQFVTFDPKKNCGVTTDYCPACGRDLNESWRKGG